LSQQTEAGITDSLNPIYDNEDLEGDAMVGLIEKALGKNPLVSDNPLRLLQSSTGEEPDIITFRVPVNFDLLASVGSLWLVVDGQGASFQQLERDTDGNSLLVWNASFDIPCPHFIAPKLVMNGNYLEDTELLAPTVVEGFGSTIFFNGTGVLRFNQARAEYDSSNGATLYAWLPELEAEYSIELIDPSAPPGSATVSIIPLKSTSSGEIFESWDLLDQRTGSAYAGDSVNAVYNVKLTGSQKSNRHKLKLRQQDPGYVQDGMYTVAYAWHKISFAEGPMRDAVQWGIVDPLLKPGQGTMTPYHSIFNEFSSPGNPGEPGWLQRVEFVEPLLENLAYFGTRNFTFNGHVNP
jgi:hypothetical protein